MGTLQFWVIATFMVVATTATLVVPLFWRARRGSADDAADTVPAARRWLAFATAAAVPLLVLGLYTLSGSPELATATVAPAGDIAVLHARAAVRGGGGENAGDLDAVIEKLRARLAANPGDASGWRLLAQSYEFQGRASEAAQANKQADQAGHALVTVSSGANVALDGESSKLAQSAQEHRRRREFPQASAAFAALAQRGGMTADLWADYADALGGARGTLDEDAAACIAAALRLDPEHAKALWLQATWQTQRQDYAAALGTWQRLARILPPESPDARIIAANLEEARGQLSSRTGVAQPAPGPAPIVLRGSVRLDPRWEKGLGGNAVLFVFARAADERGPPLAVLRTTAGPWPMSFALDDRNAMMPGRKLSDFTRVILEARISRSGNALAQPGDLRAVSAVLNPRAAPNLQLTIAEEVGAATPAQGG